MRIATVGDNCMDVYTSLGKAFPGGNPVNVAVYLKRLGEGASYVGVVGTDEYGTLMRESIARKGVDVSHLHTNPGKTAITLVELVNGERVFGDYFEGVLADFHLNEDDIAFLLSHDTIHTGFWGKIEKDLHTLHKLGALISFDFADHYEHEIIDIAIPDVDYAFFSYTNDDEFARDLMVKMQSKGPQVVVVTLAENGSLAFDGQHFYKSGIVPVSVVDTMGAGDSFIAGFLRAVFLGYDLDESLHFGAENASETLKYMGAW